MNLLSKKIKFKVILSANKFEDDSNNTFGGSFVAWWLWCNFIKDCMETDMKRVMLLFSRECFLLLFFHSPSLFEERIFSSHAFIFLLLQLLFCLLYREDTWRFEARTGKKDFDAFITKRRNRRGTWIKRERCVPKELVLILETHRGCLLTNYAVILMCLCLILLEFCRRNLHELNLQQVLRSCDEWCYDNEKEISKPWDQLWYEINASLKSLGNSFLCPWTHSKKKCPWSVNNSQQYLCRLWS